MNRHLPWKSSKEGLSVNWEFHIALIQSWGSFCNSKRRKISTAFANNLSGWNTNNIYYRFSCLFSTMNADCQINASCSYLIGVQSLLCSWRWHTTFCPHPYLTWIIKLFSSFEYINPYHYKHLLEFVSKNYQLTFFEHFVCSFS